ncbi:MAG: hypothetical protein ACTSQF_15225 [Candidatus Heimdallarchaeaceae archaeon]
MKIPSKAIDEAYELLDNPHWFLGRFRDYLEEENEEKSFYFLRKLLVRDLNVFEYEYWNRKIHLDYEEDIIGNSDLKKTLVLNKKFIRYLERNPLEVKKEIIISLKEEINEAIEMYNQHWKEDIGILEL